LTQIFQHNSCYLSNDNGFSKNSYVFTDVCLFEWKNSSRCGILHIKLKWDNEFICNIWLNTSSNLLIVWMVFEIYLHFVVYRYNYIFFTNILFNHLISTSKWDFFDNLFFWVLKYFIPIIIIFKCFNINLVEVQKHSFKNSICDNNFLSS
jgi:hypothetical protein